MGNIDLSTTELVIVLAGALVFACWLALFLFPAMRCYGRVWEKLCAGVLTLYVLGTLVGVGAAVGFLTLYVLGTFLGIGAAVGLAVVWTYDQYA